MHTKVHTKRHEVRRSISFCLPQAFCLALALLLAFLLGLCFWGFDNSIMTFFRPFEAMFVRSCHFESFWIIKVATFLHKRNVTSVFC